MATNEETIAHLDAVIDKVEDVVATTQGAIDAVEEALREAAGAFGMGSAGRDAAVAENLVALKFVLEEELMGKAKAALEAATESREHHNS